MALFGFTNALGWWAFLSLLPFLLIYLIKPKPKELDVPSLMFFTKSLFSERERSFLRKFTSDWLFLLQLLLLLLLSAFFVGPYINLREGAFLHQVVIVLDTSASMRVGDRFSSALGKAKDLLGSTNTILLVSNSPRIGVKEANKEDALQFLRGLKARDTRSNIGDTIVLAGEYAKGENPVVYVLSDFLSTEGAAVDVAVNALKTKGVTVNLIDVHKEKVRKNTGIVDVNAEEETTQLLVQNFNEDQQKVRLTINDLEKELVLGPRSKETFSFKTPAGVTKIELSPKDDFMVDNLAYVSKPKGERIRVLLVTNDETSIYLRAALTASDDITVEVSKPPIIPSEAYDVYIVYNVDRKLIITGLFEKIRENVEGGASAIIHVQKDSNLIDYKSLAGFAFGESVRFGTLAVDQINRFTRDVEFGNVNHYFKTLNNKMTSMVSTDNSSIVALQKLKAGKLAYYGILEDTNDFKLNPSYPVFWVNLVKFLANIGEVRDLNVHTGSVLTFDGRTSVRTPSRTVTSEVVTLDEVGIYEAGFNVYAANLNSEAESDINGAFVDQELRERALALKSEEGVHRDLSIVLLVVILALLFLETLAVKLRGDV